MNRLLAVVVLVGVVLLGYYLIDIRKSPDGTVHVDVGTIKVGTETKEVNVPSVQVGTKEQDVRVPKVTVEPPKDRAADRDAQ